MKITLHVMHDIKFSQTFANMDDMVVMHSKDFIGAPDPSDPLELGYIQPHVDFAKNYNKGLFVEPSAETARVYLKFFSTVIKVALIINIA